MEARADATARTDGATTGLRGLVVAVAIIAALLLVVAEFSTIASVEVVGDSCEVVNDSNPELADRCALSGWERHGGALLLLALVAVGGAVAVRRGADEAGGGVIAAVGVVVLALTLFADLPVTHETGAVGLNFDGASGQAGLGFYLELIAGLLCVLAGAVTLAAGRRGRTPASDA